MEERRDVSHSTVCVTGASGFVGSWLVKCLIERGYFVRGAVRNLEDPAKTAHLLALPGAKDQLKLVQAELADQDSLVEAFNSCDGVFHVATPYFQSEDPEKELIQPSVTGALNVLDACLKVGSVKRVVMTSTIFTVNETDDRAQGQILNESCWSSVERFTSDKSPVWAYAVSKILAEQAAWEFSKKNNIDMVTVIPPLICGSFITPNVPGSILALLGLMNGDPRLYPFLKFWSYVHVDDVANAHILLFEEPSATGRYICSAKDAWLHEVIEEMKKNFRDFKLEADIEAIEAGAQHYIFSSEKLLNLGFRYKFDTLQKMFDDSIRCCRERGLVE